MLCCKTGAMEASDIKAKDIIRFNNSPYTKWGAFVKLSATEPYYLSLIFFISITFFTSRQPLY